MSEAIWRKMKRIFYFNITYGCNSNCVFCYSHNTCHNAKTYNEISFADFFDYLDYQKVTVEDRVIINGGEPFLHTEIDSILSKLNDYECEVLIYTNGRLLSQHDLSMLSEKCRFVIPIHGYETIHDSITGVQGSYQETLNGLLYLTESTKCLIDIKIIINNDMISKDYSGEKLFNSLENVRFNNAVHITKMADTIISVKNGCKSVTNEDAAYYTKMLFEYFQNKNRIVKIFDTCIKEIVFHENESYRKYDKEIIVFFKDKNQARKIDIAKRNMECMNTCESCNMCISAVDEYKVLEYFKGKIFESLE